MNEQHGFDATCASAAAVLPASTSAAPVRKADWPRCGGPGTASAPLQFAPLRSCSDCSWRTRRHVTPIGATGSGKTTTLSRAHRGALNADWSVLVVDAKGGRLLRLPTARAVHHQPTRIWLPADADSWTYDPCAGDQRRLATDWLERSSTAHARLSESVTGSGAPGSARWLTAANPARSTRSATA